MTAAERAMEWARSGPELGAHGGEIRVDLVPAKFRPSGTAHHEPSPGDADAPPATTNDATTPWERELAKALQDVQSAIANNGSHAREPMFIPAAELFTRDYPPTSWLVTGLITRGGIVTIGAEPKASKTWLGTEIALAISSGTKVCGEFYAEQGRVAYFYAEDLDRQVRNRLRALSAGRGVDPASAVGNLFLQPRGKFLDVTKDTDMAWLIASCRRLGKLDLLVLDPLRDISSAAEDKSDEMGPLMRRLRLVGELLGCTVAIVHHAGKASENTAKRRPGQRLRGSGAIHGSTDSGIYLGELDGDGSSVFRNTVDSEIKGARSAGRFALELKVEDDEQGEAVRATWTVTRDTGESKPSAKVAATAAKTARAEMDDDAVFAFVRELAMRGEHLTRRALRDHDARPLAVKRVTAALDRLIEVGRLRLVGNEVHLLEAAQGDER
ncbi:MAG TPA: AAA family ATPase [Kofleriaceae bacterium]|nr:AAA family ATPase [Kofleriaceae bacterium]